MLELVNEIILNETLPEKEKILLLEKILKPKLLTNLPIAALEQLYAVISDYLEIFPINVKISPKQTLKDSGNIRKNSMIMAKINITDSFCNKALIQILLSDSNIPNWGAFHHLLTKLHIFKNENYDKNENTDYFRLCIIHSFLDYYWKWLENKKEKFIYLFSCLSSLEQKQWLTIHKNDITKTIYENHEQTIGEFFSTIYPNILFSCYTDDWKKAMATLNNSALLKLLNAKPEFQYFESFEQILKKQKKVSSFHECSDFCSYLYFGQSTLELQKLSQIFTQTTYLSSLPEKEQQVCNLILNLFGTTFNKAIKELEQIEDYQSILYDACYHLRLLAATNLVSNTFSIEQYQGQKDITIYPDNLQYFFIRTNHWDNPFISEGKKVNAASFSIISTSNPSTYLGDKRTIFGFSHINPNMIVHILAHDSLSKSIEHFPYFASQYEPQFIDIYTLMEKSRELDTYSEIIVLKKQFKKEILKPDYILGINEFSKQDLEFAERLSIPKVKLLIDNKTQINTCDYYSTKSMKLWH